MASKPPCRASCAGAAAFCVHNFFTAPAVYTQIKGVYNIIMCLYPGRTSKTGRKLHHGNTKKIIDEIAKTNDVELIDATQTVEKDLSEAFHARDLIRSDRSS